MEGNSKINNLLIAGSIVLAVILAFNIFVDLGEYFHNKYDYNITLTKTSDEKEKFIIEGLFKLKNIKYKKNDSGQLQVRGKDEDLFRAILKLSDSYDNYKFIAANKENEIVAEMKSKNLRFATIRDNVKDLILIIWEEIPLK